jgi:hypothetical protein
MKKTKNRAIRNRPKPLAVAIQKENEDRVRLAIECTTKQRKYIKTFAALEDKSINQFVLDCVWKYAKCTKSHIPNKETSDALDASERGEGHRAHQSIEEMFKFLGI